MRRAGPSATATRIVPERRRHPPRAAGRAGRRGGRPPAPPDRDPEALAFTGPGGGNGIARGERTSLSPGNLRRAFKHAGIRARLTGLMLKGSHDLRHTFATWLEDAGLPTRVIDEVMDHRSARQVGERGSAIGVVYRRATRDMEIRIARAVDGRLEVAQPTAASVWAGMSRQQPHSGRPTAPRRPRHAKSAAG
jgi:integrase